MAKYYIFRKSKFTGFVEVRQTKCLDEWCGEKYLELHPERVWKFSKSGADRIIDREVSRNRKDWAYDYWKVEA